MIEEEVVVKTMSVDGPTLIVDECPTRTRLHITALSGIGIYIGVTKGLTSANGYFITQYGHLLVEKYFGPIYAISPTSGTAVNVSVFQE